MDLVTILIIFIFGLEFGSFANVCIYRWPRNLSILKPLRSRCNWCKKQIRWFDNIPVLSFILLHGRCRNCHKSISRRYPLVELSMGVLWVLGYRLLYIPLNQSNLIFLVLILIFLFVLVVTTITDFDWKIIPDQATYALILLGLSLSSFNPVLQQQSNRPPFLESLFGLFLGGGLLFLISFAGKLIFKKEALGGGDIKLLAGIGAVLGPHGVLWTLFLSTMVAGFVSFAGLVVGWVKRGQYIPFGPFLTSSSLVALYMAVHTPLVTLSFV